MHPSELAERLAGPIAFPVTIFNDDDDKSVDLEALAAHIDLVVSGGVSAIVIAGGTGEYFSLSMEEINDVIQVGVRAVRGRVPVLAGVGFGPRQGAALARAARDIGVDGLVILPPYYPTPDPGGLVAYYRSVASAVPDVGVVPYSRGAAKLTPDILRGLADVPNVVAFKDGHGDVRMFLRNRFALGKRYVWIAGAGDDLVGAYAAAGAAAYTSSIACFDPVLAVELWRLASSGMSAALDQLLFDRVLPWYEMRSRRPGYEVSVMKGAMEALGYRAGPVRPPLAQLTTEDSLEVKRLAGRLGLWTSEPRT